MLAEGGLLVALTAFLFTFSFNIMETAMKQSTDLMTAVDSGDPTRINSELQKTDSFIKGTTYSSLNYLENVFSSVDTSNLNDGQKTEITEALDKIAQIKAELGQQNRNEQLEKDLDELEDYLEGLN